MKLPLYSRAKSHKIYKIGAFGGYNNTPSCSEKEFSKMKNLSSKHFPAMSPISNWALFDKDIYDFFLYENTLFKIDNKGDFYKNSTLIREGMGTETREFSVLGDKLIIMPDKLCYSMTTGAICSLEASWSGVGSFSADSMSLTNTLTTAADLSSLFKEGDCVRLSINGEDKGFYCIWGIKDGKTVFENADFTEASGECSISIERTLPSLRNTFECNNRLWGTCGNTVYASALGDPFNFYKYRGISTDSYFKEIYSAGDFTCGIAYGETPLFFKESSIYRIYGNTPDSFVADVKEAPGVSFDCRHSAVTLGGCVYYAAADGIYVYSSAYPTKISQNLGDLKIGTAMGGTDGKRYYISFSEFHGIKDEMAAILEAYHNYMLYAFDSENGCWYKYDDSLRIKKISTGLYGSIFKKPNTIALDSEGNLFGISDKLAGTTSDRLIDDAVIMTSSMGISGIIDFGCVSRISSIKLLLRSYENTEFYGEISFDGGGFIPFCKIHGGDGIEKSYTFRVKNKRFSYCRLKLGGVGDYELYGAEIYYDHSYHKEK